MARAMPKELCSMRWTDPPPPLDLDDPNYAAAAGAGLLTIPRWTMRLGS